MELAECASLLGQLQRGRGSGFRRASTESPHVVRPLLVTCVLEDPRWDRQLESRADYYAALIIHAGLSLESFDTYLRGLKEPASQDPNDLCLMTLCALAIRGYAPAAVILRAYLFYGECWDMAFEALMAAPEAAISANEMSRILDERFPEDGTLDDELWMPATIAQKRREPWQSLSMVNSRVARIFSKHEQEEEQRERRQEQIQARCADMPTANLLAEVSGDNYRFVVAALKRRVSAADVNLLLQTAQYGQQRQRVVAFRGLQQLAHPAALPLLRAFFEQPAERPSSVYGAAVAAMEALPPTLTLDLAREWFDTPDAPQRHVARRILAAHATVDDVPHARVALQASLQEESPDWHDYFFMCDMIEILGHFPEAGPYPEVEVAFKEAGYARTRLYAAKTLLSSNPDRFSRGLAVECLWDCEEEVRQIGCDGVDMRADGAHARLQALANDPFEESSVRYTAKERISATH